GVKPGAALAYWRDLETRLRGVPGVADVALSSLPPFGNSVSINAERTVFYHVTPSFFGTMGIPLRRGRLLAEGDRDAVLVSETLARRRWPGVDPIGQTFDDATVVGVVGDARSVRIGDASATECYVPMDAGHLS